MGRREGLSIRIGSSVRCEDPLHIVRNTWEANVEI